jgi:hypothetical protein
MEKQQEFIKKFAELFYEIEITELSMEAEF